MGSLALDYRTVLLWLRYSARPHSSLHTHDVVLSLEDGLPAFTLVLTFIGPSFLGCSRQDSQFHTGLFCDT